MDFPNKKYKVIVIDPPWPIEPMILKKYQLSIPYKTMSLEDIGNLDIEALADEHSLLFLWTTHRFLPDAFPLLLKWGFRFYALLTWDKVSGLTHQGVFRRTEMILMGYHGNLTKVLPQKGSPIPTLFREAKGKHSEKPETFDNIIRKCTPEPRLDMFARKRKIGFDSYGDETPEEEIETLESFT